MNYEELDNEREKRVHELEVLREKQDHELALAKLAQPRTALTAFWDMLNGSLFWVLLILAMLARAVIKLATGKDWFW